MIHVPHIVYPLLSELYLHIHPHQIRFEIKLSLATGRYLSSFVDSHLHNNSHHLNPLY